MTASTTPALLTREQAAAYLNISPKTLAKWASEGTSSLKYVKVGRLVRYRQEDLAAFLQAQLVEHQG